MNYEIRAIICGAYHENAYLLLPEGRNDCILIDPGDDIDKLQDAIAASGRRLGGILLTHAHFDHMLAAQPLSRLTGAPVYLHPADEFLLENKENCAYDEFCSKLPFPEEMETEPLGNDIDLCGLHFAVLSTPGHTKGSVCFYDAENNRLFCGDTLFCGGYGRMDLPGGSMADMRTSLRRLFELPAETQAFSGHGISTTIGDETARYGL